MKNKIKLFNTITRKTNTDGSCTEAKNKDERTK